MNYNEHLLTILAEECNEIGQRAHKALRFGLDEIYKNHPDGKSLTNAERIMQEYDDLQGVLIICQEKGLLPSSNHENVELKIKKIEKYLEYSKLVGTLK